MLLTTEVKLECSGLRRLVHLRTLAGDEIERNPATEKGSQSFQVQWTSIWPRDLPHTDETRLHRFLSDASFWSIHHFNLAERVMDDTAISGSFT